MVLTEMYIAKLTDEQKNLTDGQKSTDKKIDFLLIENKKKISSLEDKSYGQYKEVKQQLREIRNGLGMAFEKVSAD